MDSDFQRRITFILEIDRLKTILRQTLITDASRQETTAEHSWHLGVMAFLLADHALGPIDVLRTVKMCLVHDIVEIDAGDTFAYDAVGYQDKEAREQRAADRIFGLLPESQAAEIRALWDEFEAAQTPESRFANALDRRGNLVPPHGQPSASHRSHAVRPHRSARSLAPGGRHHQRSLRQRLAEIGQNP
jgi:putative hydrolases of HD superfamily